MLHQNVKKGSAPTSSNMNMAFDSINSVGANYELEDPTTRENVSLSRSRMWSLRFRMEWNLRFGKAPSRDRMETDVLTEKAFL